MEAQCGAVPVPAISVLVKGTVTANLRQKIKSFSELDSNLLVADIGGSNARLGVVIEGMLMHPMVFRCAEFDSLHSLLTCFFQQSGQSVRNAVIAVASEVDSDNIAFTNSAWQFSVSELAHRLEFDQLKILNDFSALALAIPFLRDDQLRAIFHRRTAEINTDPDSAKGLIGAGTGLGVSGLVPDIDRWLPIQGEGGHVRYGPADEFERELFQLIAPNESYISAESLLSGSGLLRLYEGISRLSGERSIYRTPGEIVNSGKNQCDRISYETLNLYCGIFGDVAGDIALILGATGGMYIGGGVVNHMSDFFCQSKIFRQRFENKGLKRGMIESIPTFLITDTNAALVGASVAHHPVYNKLGINYSR